MRASLALVLNPAAALTSSTKDFFCSESKPDLSDPYKARSILIFSTMARVSLATVSPTTDESLSSITWSTTLFTFSVNCFNCSSVKFIFTFPLRSLVLVVFGKHFARSRIYCAQKLMQGLIFFKTLEANSHGFRPLVFRGLPISSILPLATLGLRRLCCIVKFSQGSAYGF